MFITPEAEHLSIDLHELSAVQGANREIIPAEREQLLLDLEGKRLVMNRELGEHSDRSPRSEG